jgi:hypothetical protein
MGVCIGVSLTLLMCIGSLDNWFGFSLIEAGCAADALSHDIWIVWFGVSRVRVCADVHWKSGQLVRIQFD